MTGTGLDHHVYAITIDGEPLYIGLSRTADRFQQHLRSARRYLRGPVIATADHRTQLVHKKLARCIEEGRSIEFLILADGLTQCEAAKLETDLISLFPPRQLWNRHRGGLGGSSAGASAALSMKWKEDGEFRARQSVRARATLIETLSNPEIAERRRASVSAMWTPEKRAEKAEHSRRIARDPEIQARRLAGIRASVAARFSDPEYRARYAEARRQSALKRRAGLLP